VIKVYIALFLSTCLLIADNPAEYYPESNETTTELLNSENSSEEGEESTVFSTVRKSNMTVKRDTDGTYKAYKTNKDGELVQTDVNASMPYELIKFSKEIKGRANFNVLSSIINENNLTDVISQDPENSSYDNLMINRGDTSIMSSLTKGRQLAETIALAQAPISNFIRCYISRKLMPAMMCPIQEKTAIFGGDIGSDVDAQKKECDEYCQEDFSCFSIDQNLQKSKNLSMSGSISGGLVLTEALDDRLRLQTIEMRFSLSEEIYEQYPDFNITKTPLQFKYDLSLTHQNGDVYEMYKGAQIYLKDEVIVFKAHLSGVFQKIDMAFFDIVNSKENEPAEWPVQLESVIANYEDTKYYYCDAIQTIPLGAICKGKRVQVVTDSGILKDICVTEDGKSGPEPTTGGYYSKNACNTKCYISQDCTPTYTVPGTDITVNAYETDIGCIDTPENARCTISKCKKLFADNNSTIFEEFNYINEIEKVITVQNEIPTREMRPNIILAGEITETGPGSQTFIDSMKDHAYIEMVENSRYTHTNYTLEKPTDIQMGYTFNLIAKDVRELTWKIKPSNIAYDNTAKYKYVVMKLTHSIRPLDGVYNTNGNQINITGEELFNDITYALMLSPSNFQVFKQDFQSQYFEIITEAVDASGAAGSINTMERGQWLNLLGYGTSNLMYDAINDEWLSYSLSSYAPSFNNGIFEKGIPVKEFLIFTDMYADIESMNGGYVHSQKDAAGNVKRIYSGDWNEIEQSRFHKVELYGFYSDYRLTYTEVQNNLIEKNIFFDSLNRRKYNHSITGDALINRRIELYLQGPINDMSVVSKIKPNDYDIGNKAFIFTLIQ